jgi:hypothetical protein
LTTENPARHPREHEVATIMPLVSACCASDATVPLMVVQRSCAPAGNSPHTECCRMPECQPTTTNRAVLPSTAAQSGMLQPSSVPHDASPVLCTQGQNAQSTLAMHRQDAQTRAHPHTRTHATRFCCPVTLPHHKKTSVNAHNSITAVETQERAAVLCTRGK